MAFPTVTVTPGSGQTVNTLPNAGQATSANSLPVVIASDQSGVNTGAAASGYVDGWDITQGTKADTAWTTGSGSVISVLKAIDRDINAPIPGAVTTSPPTYTSGTTAGFSLTTGGAMRSDLSSYNGTSLTGTVTAYGTAPTGNVFGVNANITNTVSVSGTVTANAGTGTFAISAASLPLPSGAAVSVAQASTTSGQAGGLVMGAVTTAAPTYTTGNTNPVSLTTGGSLRGDVSSYAGTALTGTVTAYGTAPTGNVFGVNAAVTSGTLTTVSTVTNISQIASNVPAYAVASGSTNKAAAVTIGTAVSVTDQNGTAFAGAGSVLGTVVASAQGGGAVITAEVNVSALTLGTATAVFAILQESRGGTNFSDIWVSPPITATGIISTPPLVVAGRRRWRFFSIGGTSTTVTVTITSLELPAGGYPLVREGYDGFSATNPLATMFNNATTASTLVSTTLSSTSNPIYIEGAKNLMASLTVTGGVPTTNPVLTLQTSIDGTNWFNSTLTLTPTAAGTFGASLANIIGRFARFIVSTASAGGTAYTFGKLGLLATN